VRYPPQQTFVVSPGLAGKLATIVRLAEYVTGTEVRPGDLENLRAFVLSHQVQEWADTVKPRKRRGRYPPR
jgi:hypothetical protein